MDALTAHPDPIPNLGRTYTTNGAQAHNSTSGSILDSFNRLTRDVFSADVGRYLTASWKESPELTLRLIWNLRSIHDGLGEKELFYRAYRWLYDNHPRTAIFNLRNLVTPVCTTKNKEGGKSRGYWKDLLDILALETVDELSNISQKAQYLHHPRSPFTYGCNKNRTQIDMPESRIEASLLASQKVSAEAAILKREKESSNHERLLHKLPQCKFRALFTTVARLSADEIGRDLKVVLDIGALLPGKDCLSLVKKLSLARKWAPTPGRSHDRITNISTAISELIYVSQILPSHAYPSALKSALPFILPAVDSHGATPCIGIPRAFDVWRKVEGNQLQPCFGQGYENNMSLFKHAMEGFEKYLESVEENKKPICGATLPSHELVAQVLL